MSRLEPWRQASAKDRSGNTVPPSELITARAICVTSYESLAHIGLRQLLKTDGMNGNQWSLPPSRNRGGSRCPCHGFVEEPDSRNYNLGTWVIDADT
jgi:hypothetical protein